MRVRIVGTELPGIGEITVGVQKGRETVDRVRGDADRAVFEFEIGVRDGDPRGPYVHGRRGERFLYLVWERDGVMFRRAKLMLAPVDLTAEGVTGELLLTDSCGGPVCAQTRVTWSRGQAGRAGPGADEAR
jgi:hypothetical protein